MIRQITDTKSRRGDRHEINAMLAGEFEKIRGWSSWWPSEVRVQPDMKHARVFISVKGTNKEQTTRSRPWSMLPDSSGANWSSASTRRVPELHSY